MNEHPAIAHRPWCHDRTVREGDIPFRRGTIRLRCLGCGAEVEYPRQVTQ